MMWFEEALARIEKRGGAKVAEAFRAAGLPGPKNEGWQHGELCQFFMMDGNILVKDSIKSSDIPVADGPCIVLWNGTYLADRSVLPEGVTVQVEDPTMPDYEEGALFQSLADALAANVRITISQSQSDPLRVLSYVEGIL